MWIGSDDGTDEDYTLAMVPIEHRRNREIGARCNFRLPALKGALEGFWSIWVNGNWRVTFRFAGVNVELVGDQDYHSKRRRS